MKGTGKRICDDVVIAWLLKQHTICIAFKFFFTGPSCWGCKSWSSLFSTGLGALLALLVTMWRTTPLIGSTAPSSISAAWLYVHLYVSMYIYVSLCTSLCGISHPEAFLASRNPPGSPHPSFALATSLPSWMQLRCKKLLSVRECSGVCLVGKMLLVMVLLSRLMVKYFTILMVKYKYDRGL